MTRRALQIRQPTLEPELVTMLRHFIHCCALTICWAALFTSSLSAQEVGEVVVVIKTTDLKAGNQTVGSITRGSFRTVQAREGIWVGLESNRPGWIKIEYVVDLERAVYYFTRAIEYNPQDSVAYISRGLARHIQGDYDQAINDFDKATQLDPKNSLAFSNRGLSWSSKGEFAIAIKDFNDAIQLNPRDVDACFRRAQAYIGQGNYDEAILNFNKVLWLKPKHQDVFYHRGLAWISKRQYDKAIDDFNQAIRFNPKDTNAYIHRGIAFGFKANYDKAITDYHTAFHIDPMNALAYGNLAQLLADCPDAKYRDGQKAILHAKKACDLTESKDQRFLSTLAAAFAESGRFKDAIKWQNKAIRVAPRKEVADLRAHLNLYKAGKAFRR